MEKYKIYVHHKYTHERFWYFFHGVDIDIDNVVTHVDNETAFNRNKITDKVVTISSVYNENELDISFVGDSNWNDEGHHIFDYSIFLYDNKLASDRGFNSNIMSIIDTQLIPKFNSLSKNKNCKYHFIYIKWEGHHSYGQHDMQRVLNSSVNVYGDDFIKYFKADNYLFLFTHSVMSFIYPNTLGLREFYFMSKFIRNKKNKHKLNFPIRRLYGGKIKLYNQINQCKNINVTHSSFHNTKQYSNDQVDGFRGILIDNIGNDNFIEKRGYGIDDWGGEWNDDNIKEMMFKLYNIADVNIIPEYSVKEAIKNIAPQDFEKLKFKLGTSHITEKSVSHILIAKPFIPVSYETIDFYQKMMIRYGKKYKEYPLSYSHISEIIYDIDHIASNNVEWDLLVNKLQEWVDTIRENIIEIIDTKNDLLECICSTSESNLNGKNNII